MTLRNLGRTGAASVLLGVAMNPLFPSAVLAAGKDGDVVFCLSSEQRSRLVETAVILGLAGPALPTAQPTTAGPASAPPTPAGTTAAGGFAPSTNALQMWRTNNPAAFDRACSALVAAAQVPQAAKVAAPSQFKNILTVLIPALAGALVSWLFAVHLATLNARRAQASALRSAKKQFDRDAQALIDLRGAALPGLVAPDDRLRDARIELANQLDEVSALHPRWNEPEHVREALESAELARAWAAARFDGSDSQRAASIRAARTEVHEVMGRVERVALAVQQPFRPHGRMRPSGSTTVSALTSGNRA